MRKNDRKLFRLLIFIAITCASFALPTARAVPTLEYQSTPESSIPYNYLALRTAILADFQRRLAEQNNPPDLFLQEVETELGTAEHVWASATVWAARSTRSDFKLFLKKSLDLLQSIDILVQAEPTNSDRIRESAITKFRIYERLLLGAMAFDLKIIRKANGSPTNFSKALRSTLIADSLFMTALAITRQKGFEPFGDATATVFNTSIAFLLGILPVDYFYGRFQTTYAVKKLDAASTAQKLPTNAQAPLEVRLREALKRWADHSQLKCENVFEI